MFLIYTIIPLTKTFMSAQFTEMFVRLSHGTNIDEKQQAFLGPYNKIVLLLLIF